MPIYEYRCTDCGKTFESIQKFNDEPFTNCGQSNVECPTKGSGTVERQMSAPSFQFKGTGFYITDYKNQSVSKPAGAGGSEGKSSSSEGKSESKSEGKSESKSESKTPAKTESKPESKPAATKSSDSSSSGKKDS